MAKTSKGDQTRARIIRAARELFAAAAYDRVSVRKIAAAAGVDAALINHYFGGKEKNELSRYHFKQSLGLGITLIIIFVILGIIGAIVPKIVSIVGGLVSLCALIFMILGIVNAANEEKKALPVIGKFFENQFAFIDK